METKEQILKQTQTVARLERKLAQEKLKQRKAETRRKIELGGLVVKAKMDHFPKDIILGVLIKAKEEIANDPSAEMRYRYAGEAAFSGYHGDENRDEHKVSN